MKKQNSPRPEGAQEKEPNITLSGTDIPNALPDEIKDLFLELRSRGENLKKSGFKPNLNLIDDAERLFEEMTASHHGSEPAVEREKSPSLGYKLFPYVRWAYTKGNYARPKKPRIVKPPGAQWMRIARFFFSLESVTEIFEPLCKDFWYEYEKEFVVGHKWKACWIRVRYYWAFTKAAGLLKLFSWIWDKVEAVFNKFA